MGIFVLLIGGIAYVIASGRSAREVKNATAPTIVPVASSTTTTLPSTTTLPPTTTTTDAPLNAGPTYAVGVATYTLSEPGKYLCAPHGATSGCIMRTMPLYVLFPAAGTPGTVVNGAMPDRSGGSYPLVVFGNGYLENVLSYSVILDYWASRGYVVAAPQFPLSQVNSVGGPWEADILNQPGDLSAAISYMISQDSLSSSTFYKLIDPGEIAVVGQSDGADDALAVGYNTCCKDPRVKAVISLSGAELSSYPGKYFASQGPPLLIVQGTDDTINVPSDSQTAFDAAGPPKYYLSLIGADHLDGYQEVDEYSQAVQQVTVSFLDYYLKGQAGALDEMNKAGNVAGTDSLS